MQLEKKMSASLKDEKTWENGTVMSVVIFVPAHLLMQPSDRRIVIFVHQLCEY